MLSAAKYDRLEALWILALTTGIREGEALALKRLDADLQAGTLRISRTVYNGVVGTPKSKRSRRTITLPSIAHDALQRHIERGEYGDDDYLFPNGRGKPINPCGEPTSYAITGNLCLIGRVLSTGCSIPVGITFVRLC